MPPVPSWFPKSGIAALRLLDWKSGRQRILRQLPLWRDYKDSLAISPDGRLFAVADTYTVYRSVGHRMITAEKETTFIEIRETKTGRKIASLKLPNVGLSPTLAFAPDNSVLYFQITGLKRWPKSSGKSGLCGLTGVLHKPDVENKESGDVTEVTPKLKHLPGWY